MALVPIENVGNYGIITDEPPHRLPPEAWSAGNNVRFLNGRAGKARGDADVYGTPNVAPHYLLPWRTATEYRWIYGGTAQVHYTNGSTHTNITRYTAVAGDNDYSAGTRPIWTGGILHGVPILNNNGGSDYPQQWDGAISRLKDLTNWPANYYAQVIRPYNNFLVALDITKSAVRYPYLVLWSHPADAGTVPPSWNVADATKLAGEYPISETGGFLVDCMSLGGNNILYKEDAIFLMQPTGGLDVFRFARLADSIGMLGARCGASLVKHHFIVGVDDIVLFDGITPKSIITNRLRRWFFNSLHADYPKQTVVAVNYAQQQVWICFVETGSTSEYLTKALVWSWDRDTWAVKDIPETSYLAAGQVTGVEPDTFDTSSGTFNTDFGAFGAAGDLVSERQILHARAYSSSKLVQADTGYTSRTAAYLSYLERTGLSIVGRDREGNPRTDQSTNKFLRAIYPKVEASAPVTLNVYAGSQDTPDGAVRWEGPQTFNSATDVKVDFSVNGRYLAVRFEDASTQQEWELLGYNLDMDVVGVL